MKNPITSLFKSVSAVTQPDGTSVEIPDEWLQPISADMPCGPPLEYDPEFAVLAARLQPKADVQYGTFTSTPTEPDWKEIERDCRRLLLRSRDLTILIWFARSRSRQAGAAGLLQGLWAIRQMCERFNEALHPQLHMEDEWDPVVRANTLASLCDPEGLLNDLREIVVVSGTAQRLTVRDVERSRAIPRPPYAPSTESVKRQLADLHQRQDPHLRALQACASCVLFLMEWAKATLHEDAPNLQPLMNVLEPLMVSSINEASLPAEYVKAEMVDTPEPAHGLAPSLHETATGAPLLMHLQPTQTTAGSVQQSREQVREALSQVRLWIEHHEPSSPVAVLLKQAERMWGKRFSEVAHLIPADLLKAWDQND